MERVQLQSAFAWSCPLCSARNLAEASRGWLQKEHAEQLKSEMLDVCWEAVPDFEDAGVEQAEFLVTRVAVGPYKVTCPTCKATFTTEVESHEEGQG